MQLFRIFKLDFRLVTRKESDLQLCLDVKAARSWKKADQIRHGGCRKCAVSPSRYLHNSNSRPSMAQLQQCRIILSSAFGRYCTYVQTVWLSVKFSET